MKPYGRIKTVSGSICGKRDIHPRPKREWVNWWENVCSYLVRTEIKRRWKREIEREIIENLQ